MRVLLVKKLVSQKDTCSDILRIPAKNINVCCSICLQQNNLQIELINNLLIDNQLYICFGLNPNNSMKSLFYSIVFLLISFCVNAQENSTFNTGFEETVSSKILGQVRKVWIHIPNSNGGNKIKDRGYYPVIYLLDGSENFNTVVSIRTYG